MFCRKIFNPFQSKRFINTCIPEKPSWDLLSPTKKIKLDAIDIKKLESLSMLTIDSKIEKDLNDVINIVERMCNAKIETHAKSLIYYEYLGSNKIRNDSEKLPYSAENVERDKSVLNNAAYRYEEYFISPGK